MWRQVLNLIIRHSFSSLDICLSICGSPIERRTASVGTLSESRPIRMLLAESSQKSQQAPLDLRNRMTGEYHGFGIGFDQMHNAAGDRAISSARSTLRS